MINLCAFVLDTGLKEDWEVMLLEPMSLLLSCHHTWNCEISWLGGCNLAEISGGK